MALHWHETTDGFAATGFRIRRLAGTEPRWQLDAAPYRISSRGPAGVATSFHRRLRDAKRQAETLEAERRKRALIRGHVIVGILAALVFVVTASTVTGIPLFVATILSGYVGLRSFVSAISIAVGDVWNWTRDGGLAQQPNRWDRLVQRWIALLDGPPEWSTPAEAESAVSVVRPFDDRHPFSRRRGP